VGDAALWVSDVCALAEEGGTALVAVFAGACALVAGAFFAKTGVVGGVSSLSSRTIVSLFGVGAA
jgi:hypothetical protein